MFKESLPEKGIFTLNEAPQMIAYLREKLKLNPKDFGEPVGLTHAMVLDTESGVRKLGVSTLLKISEYYKLNITINVNEDTI